MEWLVVILVISGIVVVLGLGRAMFNGYPMTFREFIFTMFFLDIVSDAWGGDDPAAEDSNVGDVDLD